MKISSISKWGKTWRYFFVSLGLAIFVLCFYFFVFFKIRSGIVRIESLNGSVENLTSQNKIITSAKESLVATTDVRNKIDAYFVAKNGEVDFLNYIQTLGEGMGLSLEITSVDIASPKDLPGLFETLNLELTVDGSWSNVYRFAAALELLPYKVVLNEIHLNKVFQGAVPTDSKKIVTPKFSWKGDFKITVLKFK